MEKTYKEKLHLNFRDLINNSAEKFKNRTAFLLKEGSNYNKVSYKKFREHYYRLCTSFIKMGLKGKRIAVVGKNCYEWVLSYVAGATVGVAVPIDKELSAEDINNFVEAGECSAVCCEKKFEKEISEGVSVFSFEEVRKLASADTAIDFETVDGIEIKKDEMRVLIFTSGTTGSSKGVCLSQHNICSNIHSTVRMVKVKKSDRVLSILPLHHTYESTLDCLLILSRGTSITYAESLRTVAKNVKEYSPTILVVVPELLKFLASRLKSGILQQCPKKYCELFENNSLGDALKKLPLPVRMVIRNKVRKNLGGKLRLFIVGAAALDTSLVDDFAALGIRTLQGYGLTECSPLLAGNNDFFMNPRSTGVAIPGVQLKIDEPNSEGIGEILAKGENIMLGYYKDEEATKAVFKDGWFCTGDLGRFDGDGALFITGRKKNIIIGDNGKNVYPEELENRISSHPLIGDVIVVADTTSGKTQVKAKIFPNLDFLREKFGELPSWEEIEKMVRETVAAVNSKLPSYKHVKIVEILNTALEKTTTRKTKRFGANMA